MTDNKHDSLLSALKTRAEASLLNIDELTDEALDIATSETINAIGNKNVKSWAIADFAYCRLKIYLKINLSEDDLLIFQTAKKEIDASLSTQPENIIISNAKVGNKDTEWT